MIAFLFCLASFCFEQTESFSTSDSTSFRLRPSTPTAVFASSQETDSQVATQTKSTEDQESNGSDTASLNDDGRDEDSSTTSEYDFWSASSVLRNSGLYANSNGYSMTSGYSRFLDKDKKKSSRLSRLMKNKANEQNDMNEDGYADMQQRGRNRSLLQKVLRLPFRTAKKVLSRETVEPGTLILVRHGESEWNKNKTFTGWADPDLTDQGKREVEHAARLLMEGGYHYDIHVVFTSRLKRAIRSTWILLQEFNKVYLPVFKSWRLNERHYGALTGLNKTQTAERLGEELVQSWRGSLRNRPPALTELDSYWPGRDRKYADLTKEQLPRTESLLDCMERTKPVWDKKILFELKKGRNVLVVAHANTLRGLVKTIDNIGDEEIQDVAIPTGIPIVYKFEKLADGKLRSVPPKSQEHSVSQLHMKGQFLEKPGLLKEALKLEGDWTKQVPGYDDTMSRHTRPMTRLERSLYKLNAVRELGEWAQEFIDLDADVDEDDGNDGNGIFISPEIKKPKTPQEETIDSETLSSSSTNISPADTGTENVAVLDDEVPAVPTFFAQPCVTPVPNSKNMETRRDSVIVIIRHGKTQHNKLGLFTGWEDAPLADEGIEEAKIAGRNLKKHGFEFDVVYTSWLSRALETAWFVMDEMDSLWLPIVKTWRLNERMYGELTGLSKMMVKQRHGEKQFKAWRRGFDVRPPAVSSFSKNYPGNDQRYQYIRDVRYSAKESAIRSIEQGKPLLVRKLPKTESLKDCMERTIPYFVERIAKDAVDQNKRVLISSSENAIRGLLMHLCDIPESEITGLEVRSCVRGWDAFHGLRLLLVRRCACLEPLATHRFPTQRASHKLLFLPCFHF